MQELIVSQTNSVIEHNLDAVELSIKNHIKKYDFVVNEDNVKDTKKTMAYINKDKKSFSDKHKEFVTIAQLPIHVFKERCKKIESIFDDARNRLKVQVDKYEVEKLERIKSVLLEYRNILCDEKSIDRNSIVIDDLVMLSAVTGKNTITPKTKQSIEQRVASIENEILKAKLEADEKAKLDRKIAEQARLEAEERAKQREIEQAKQYEIEKQKAVEEARKQALKETITESAPAYQAYDEKSKEPVITDDGKRIFNILISLDAKLPENVPEEAVKKYIIDKLGVDFSKLIKSIEVR